MKLLSRIAVAVGAFCALTAVAPAYAADSPQKREMRSAWVATVFNIDWPKTKVSTTGNTTQINRQKNELTTLLDSMALNNMNAVNLQVRSRCDAMYKSSFEPWSSDLVSTRGIDPGYDPLAYCVEECHKRGMECHAWLNPYRYETVLNQWDGTPQAYRNDHPDWLLDVGDMSILNPAKPEVTKRICDIVAEIVTNYDIDGLLFDDYFYLSGTKEADAADYDAYKKEFEAAHKDDDSKNKPKPMALDDWRRDNVNRMVHEVYTTIKSIKPWVRFGIGPAGIAATDGAVAKKYGVTPCPTGKDWQYDGIYSEPLAWLANNDLDYISPQIYWTIGFADGDYDKATKWWSSVAKKFGRHMFVSQSISSLTKSSKAPGLSTIEETIHTLADGPNNDTFLEFANEVRLNRLYTENEAPGSLFYSAKYLYKEAPLFAHYLRTTVFNTPAILPAMSWLPVSNPGNVTNVAKNGNTLSWSGLDNVRYTVYAVPSSVPVENFSKEPEYLLGTSYSQSYTIPSAMLSGHNYAVCVLDRYGNEYSPVFLGIATKSLAAPELVSPAPGADAEMPFEFVWKEVADAGSYIIELAVDATFKNLICAQAVNDTSIMTEDLTAIPADKQIYWRVRACGNNHNDGVSASRAILPRLMAVSYPQNGASEIALEPTITFSYADRDITVEVSDNDDFSNLIVSAVTSNGAYTVPRHTLWAGTGYYVRGRYLRNGVECTTAPVSFTTIEMTPEVPVILLPENGGTLHADQCVKFKPIDGAKGIRLEISASNTFPARSSYISEKIDPLTWVDSNPGASIKISGKNLVDGSTYYARALTRYNTLETTSGKTDFCEPIAFTYSAENAGVDDITYDNHSALAWYDGVLITHEPTTVTDTQGRTVARLSTPATLCLAPGLYIAHTTTATLKFTVK